MFVHVNVKPAFWIKTLIANRLPSVLQKLITQNKIWNPYDLFRWYKETLLRHEHFATLKDLIYVRHVLPAIKAVQSLILQMNNEVFLIDWTYQFSISIFVVNL